MYYDYPPPTYLEYPILIAQGEFQNCNRVSPDVIEMHFIHQKISQLYYCLIWFRWSSSQTPQRVLNS